MRNTARKKNKYLYLCRYKLKPRTYRANPVERRNQEVKKKLCTHLTGKSPKAWARVLRLSSSSTSGPRKNAATGVTPSKTLLGYDLTSPREWQTGTQEPPPTGENRQ
uniref:Integrase catalytic domain-containing protein n=1 Tax=Photinus pyralis TaxID=7054 RepID=A0A1Y1ND58_PHOPY